MLIDGVFRRLSCAHFLRSFLVYWIWCFVVSVDAAQSPAIDWASLDSFVKAHQSKYGIPGIAVGVVHNGRLVYAKGFGYRDLESKRPVTSKTLFGIGSTTKAFAGVSVAAMVDEGRLNLDRPVLHYLSDFKLAHSEAQASTSARDLLLHRVGQARHDMMWLGTSFRRTEIFERLGFFEFNLGFRQKWQYSNLLYMAAGHLAERVAGESWEELIQTRIFNALSMNSSNTSTAVSQRQLDFSYPYKISGSARVRRNFRSVENMGPAASINSNIEDMAEWLKYQISGKSSKTILSQEMYRESQRGQILVPGEAYDRFAEFSPTEYAFAWKVQRYRGTLLRRHGGSIGGFLTTVGVLPEINAGVVVMQNIDHFGLNNYIALRAYDLLLGKAPIDWISRMNTLNSSLQWRGSSHNEFNSNNESPWNESVLEEKLFESPSHLIQGSEVCEATGRESCWEAPDSRVSAPPLPLTAYTGDFEDEAYGTLKVRLKSGKLEIAYNDWTADLTHQSGNQFGCSGGFSGKASFGVDSKNRVVSIALPFEPTVSAIRFER